MSELKSCELKVNSNPMDFAVGDTDGDRIEFAITGTLFRNKTDNTVFFNNTRLTTIDKKEVRIGDSFKVTDDKTGEEFLVRIKLQMSDSRKKWADSPKAKRLEGEAITNV